MEVKNLIHNPHKAPLFYDKFIVILTKAEALKMDNPVALLALISSH